MNTAEVLEIIFKVIGGLGIFLLGMKNMSEGMQTIAGNRLRSIINAITYNRFLSCGVGTATTMIIQSSSVTTVMAVGMVNAGLMTLVQAIGVILGANIGTTITAWIFTIKISGYGLHLIGISALFYLFSKKDRLKFWATFFLGLGLVFFGLKLMGGELKPLSKNPDFQTWFGSFSPMTEHGISYLKVWQCCLVGAAATAIIQSSSAMIGLTGILAASGTIDFTTAAALILGENIGTTITALLASIGASTNAKRASVAHVIVNIFGVIWVTSIFSYFVILSSKAAILLTGCDPALLIDKIANMTGEQEIDIKKAIAIAHSGFNIINVIILLPFVGILAKFLTKIIPDKGVKEIHHLKFLDVRMLETPAIALEQSHKEIGHMADTSERMLNLLEPQLFDPAASSENNEKIFNKENVLDNIQKEVTEFLSKTLTGHTSFEQAETARCHIRLADEYESISDYVTAILKLQLKLTKNEMVLHEEGKAELQELHKDITEYFIMINDAMKANNSDILSKAQTKGSAITFKIKQFRTQHLERVSEGKTSPLHSLIFTDMLNSYRKIKDHALNVAETIAGAK